MKDNSNDVTLEFAALIGLDWGDASHAVSLRDVSSGELECQTLVHSPEVLHEWVRALEARYGGRPVAIAVETSRGPVIHFLSEVPWLVIYPVHAATSARFRKAFAPSGAKDDAPDALVLLELLTHHRSKLRPLDPEDMETRMLGRLCELRRKSVDHRTALTNELRTLLKDYFPQALRLVGEVLHSPLALDFLKRWPDLLSLKAAKASTISRFYYLHNVRRPAAVKERLALIASAKALTTDEAVVSVGIRQLERLLEQIRIVQKHIVEDEKVIAAAFKTHPDAFLFRDLPGAGAVLAPRLLAGFGTHRDRYPDVNAFLRYSGVAPVKEKSGGRVWIHWRWNAPRFLRQSLIEWAGQSTLYCPWAKAYYQQQKARGKRHWSILRALAFKWVRILWKCWRDRRPYSEECYVQALKRKNSPLISYAL